MELVDSPSCLFKQADLIKICTSGYIRVNSDLDESYTKVALLSVQSF